MFHLMGEYPFSTGQIVCVKLFLSRKILTPSSSQWCLKSRSFVQLDRSSLQWQWFCLWHDWHCFLGCIPIFSSGKENNSASKRCRNIPSASGGLSCPYEHLISVLAEISLVIQDRGKRGLSFWQHFCLSFCEKIVEFWSSGVNLRPEVNLTIFTISPSSLCRNFGPCYRMYCFLGGQDIVSLAGVELSL